MKKLWILFGVLLFVLLAGLIILFFGHRDRPPFEAPDLALVRPVVAPEENAYPIFLAAGKALTLSEEAESELHRWRSGEGEWERGVLPSWWAEAIEANEEALRLLEQGSRLEICLAPEVHDFHDLLPHVNVWLTMARWLAAKAKGEQWAGQYAESARTCALLLRFAGLISAMPETLIDVLVGVASIEMALAQTMDLVLAARLPDEMLDHLAEVLAAMPSIQAIFARALKGEFRTAANTIDGVASGQYDGAALLVPDSPSIEMWLPLLRSSYLFQPEESKALFANFHRTAISNVSLAYVEVRAMGNPMDTLLTVRPWRHLLRPNALGSALFAIIAPALDSAIERRFEVETSLSAVRISVALHRFERRHGFWPADLDALVPEFLSEVPRDPYDGQPLRYRPELGVVYAIGQNLLDDRGAVVARVADEANDPAWQHWRKHDRVFDVWRDSPAAGEEQ